MREAHSLDYQSPYDHQSGVISIIRSLPLNPPTLHYTLLSIDRPVNGESPDSEVVNSIPVTSEATEPLKSTNGFSIANLVLNQSANTYCAKSNFEEHLKSPFGRQLHLGMGVLPVQDFESRQLANKLNSIDSRYKAAPILSLENKSDQEDEDIDDDSMSIKVDGEDKEPYVSCEQLMSNNGK